MCPDECYHLLHYVQALDYQRKALPVLGILGSKTPHIQNLTVGGAERD